MIHLTTGKRREQLDRVYVEQLWRRASKDPEWFIRTCVEIPSQRGQAEDGREPFELFDYQAEDLNAFLDEQFIIMLKCRQIGASTLIAAYVLWLALFRPGAVVLWISNSQDNADKAIGMLSVMWAYLPTWFKDRAPELVSDQAGKKEWRHRGGMKSRIRSLAGTATAGASETASLVVLDEFALIDGPVQDNLYRSTDPTTDAGGKLFILSTARGGHNRFAQMYRRAERGQSKFRAIFHPWYVSRFVNPKAERYATCPNGPCEDCVEDTIRNAKLAEFPDNPWLLDAEYPSEPEDAFRESGNPRFPSLPPLEECETDWLRGELEERDGTTMFVEDDEGPLRIRRDVFENGGPDRWRDYVLFADPSRGTGGDAFAAQVLTYDDDDEPDRVAWWHSNVIEPTDVARRLDRLGRWFEGAKGPALLAVETTGGWGDLPMNELQVHLRYPRIYFEQRTGHRKRTAATSYGFSMNAQRRPKVIDRLAAYVAETDEPCRLGGIDPLLRYELGTFVKTETGKYQADTGCHDDLVMSLAGALWVLLERVAATEAPKGEGPPVEGQSRHDLSGMFERIEKVRKQQREQIRRESRSVRRAGRRARR